MQKSDSGDNQQATITEVEKAWLAGLIDGEGSIRIDYPNGMSHSPSPRIVITNTDFAIIEKAKAICQRMGTNPHISLRKRVNPYRDVKDILVLGISKLTIILNSTMPYLTGRKLNQAKLLYRFCELRMGKDVNSLPNSQRKYSEEEIGLIWKIKDAKYQD